MPGYTTRKSIPYPQGTDAAGYTIVQTLANDIDQKIDRYRHSTGAKWYHSVAGYQESSPNLTGWVIVQTGFTATSGLDKMLRLDVRGHTYLSYNNVIDFSINFYILDWNVYSVDFHNSGTMQFKEVKIMRAIGTDKLCIAFQPDFPGNSDTWNYPKIFVDFWASYNTEPTDAQLATTTITRVTSLTNYALIHSVTLAQWTPLTLVNGWVPYDTGGHSQPRVRKINGIVEVQGLIKNGSQNADCASLPPPFRPDGGNLIFDSFGADGTTGGRVDVWTNGAVIQRGGGNAYFSLHKIMFPAAGIQ